MKKIIISVFASNLILLSSMNADIITSTKENINKTMFWKNKHLESIDYESVYRKKLYEKSYFGLAITGASIISASENAIPYAARLNLGSANLAINAER